MSSTENNLSQALKSTLLAHFIKATANKIHTKHKTAVKALVRKKESLSECQAKQNTLYSWEKDGNTRGQMNLRRKTGTSSQLPPVRSQQHPKQGFQRLPY